MPETQNKQPPARGELTLDDKNVRALVDLIAAANDVVRAAESFHELNVNNYTHDDVCNCNASAVAVVIAVKALESALDHALHTKPKVVATPA